MNPAEKTTIIELNRMKYPVVLIARINPITTTITDWFRLAGWAGN